MLKLCTHYPRGQISPQSDPQHFGIWYTTILLFLSKIEEQKDKGQKPFIGVNVCEIRDCQKFRKVKPANS